MATKKSSSDTPSRKSTASKRNTASKKDAGSKKAPARRASAKKSQARKSAPQGRSAPRAESGRRMSGMAAAAEGSRQLLELTGREAEGIVGLERTDDGWAVQVEVVEVRRIPDTTDVLALYELDVDSEGELEGYRRVRRYSRGDAGGESQR
jgi:hypothetical protein